MFKPFALFMFDRYYPAGGMGDYVGRYRCLEEALQVAEMPEYRDHDHVQVVDLRTEGIEVVYRSRNRNHR